MRSSCALAGLMALTIVTSAAPVVLRAQQASAGQATTPSVRVSSGQSRGFHDNRARPQGFSVVLVLGDLRAVAGEEDVPPAARKALTDMKDFLPYRSYRLLDAAWILCCSTGRAVTRLRGPDEREYEIEIESGSVDQSRASVRFQLRDVSSEEGMKPKTAASSKSGSITDLEKRVEAARLQLEEARKTSSPRHPEVERLSAELQAASQRLAQAKEAERHADGDRKPREALAQSKFADRSIMNTSFTMDLGETVVVGTSRLSGNSKALIALLTAVPPKSAR
jgi:hypothetical protein